MEAETARAKEVGARCRPALRQRLALLSTGRVRGSRAARTCALARHPSTPLPRPRPAPRSCARPPSARCSATSGAARATRSTRRSSWRPTWRRCTDYASSRRPGWGTLSRHLRVRGVWCVCVGGGGQPHATAWHPSASVHAFVHAQVHIASAGLGDFESALEGARGGGKGGAPRAYAVA